MESPGGTAFSPATVNSRRGRRLSMAPMLLDDDVAPAGKPTTKGKAKAGKTKSASVEDKENSAVPQKVAEALGASSLKSMSTTQMLEMYSNAVKMSAENKITQKNAWAIQLIENFDAVLDSQAQDGGSSTNFMAASATLEASMKIYSSRVDSVHTETYRVLGGLNRTDVKNPKNKSDGADDGSDSDDSDDSDEDGARRKKKRGKGKVRSGVDTLEANADNISLKTLDDDVVVDPLFKKMSASFDEGGASGLLVNNLGVFRDCEVVFDSTEVINQRVTSEMQSAHAAQMALKLDLGDLADLLPAKMDRMEICPAFHEFLSSHHEYVESKRNQMRFRGDAAGKALAQQSREAAAAESKRLSAASTVAGSVAGTDFDGDRLSIASIGGADDGWLGGFGDDAGDMDTSDAFDDCEAFGTYVLAAEQGVDVQERKLMAEIGADEGEAAAFRPTTSTFNATEFASAIVESNGSDEFAFFNPKHLSNWAGPSHWKAFKPAASTSAASKVAQKSKSKRAEFFVDFAAPVDRKALKAAFAKTNATTVMTGAAVAKAEAQDFDLPTDLHYSVRNLMSLFLKPSHTVQLRHKLTSGSAAADSVGTLDMAGAFDAFDAGAFDGGFDDDDDDGDAFGSVPADLTDLAGLGGNLIAQPRKVEKINIGYARVAKKVDVKALKEGIWDELCDGEQANRDVGNEVAGEHTFTELVESLPDHISSHMLPQVSVPFAFICLLHLANEHTLKIDDQADLQELTITQP